METITLDKRECDHLTCKLATLETELKHAQKLLEAPAKVGWWRRFWGMGVKAAVVALVVALLLLPGLSHALTLDQKALVGLKGVCVIVEDMDPQAERLGLTRDQIKTDVELRLRKAGVRVLTEKEQVETPGMPYLYVKVGTIISSSGLCAYKIDVNLREMVTLARGLKTYGAIWGNGMIGIIGTANIRKIREYAGDMVDKFINDYLAANPK